MAGLFGFFDYSKPGPGVSKDQPKKAPFLLFFELFFRKFWDLIKLNLMFCLFNLPAIIIMLILFLVFMDKTLIDDPASDMILKFITGSLLVFIPLITVGPAQCGFTYILRNYSRQEHAFLWWDFKESAKKNMKESLLISFIDIIVLIVVLFDFRVYSIFSKGNVLMNVGSGLFAVLFIIYLMMHMYIYPMLVTFKLPVKLIYKNAFIFAMMKFLPNLGILILCTALVLATFINPIIGFILMPIITFSLIGFITNFYVYPKLKKYMMDRLPVTDPEETDDEESSDNDNIDNE